MGNDQELTYLLFDLIVKQLNQMEEDERMIQRVEVVNQDMELTMKDGREYRIEINRIVATHKELNTAMDSREEEQPEIIIPVEDWEELLKACQKVLQFLEYDEKKMEKLAEFVPEFPWKKREEMIEQVVGQLHDSLAKIDRELKS